MLQEAGFSVILSSGDTAGVVVEQHYHDEGDLWFPDWRRDLRMSSADVEVIRRTPIAMSGGRPLGPERELINAYVDAIVTVADPDVIAGLAEWYRGTVVWRVNGVTDVDGFRSKLAALAIVAEKLGPRFVYTAGMPNLIPDAGKLNEHAILLPVYVDAARLPFEWLRRHSRAVVATAISHVSESQFFRRQLDELGDLDCEILGQNDPGGPSGSDRRVVGRLPRGQLYSRIASARVFLDSADRAEHIVFPPLEAMTIGTPVLFPEAGGLASMARDSGVRDKELVAAGMFSGDVRHRLAPLMHNFDELEAIARNQREIFLDGVFSFQRALASAQALRELVKTRVKKINPTLWARRWLRPNQCLSQRAPPSVPVVSRLSGGEAYLPGRFVGVHELRGQVGRLEGGSGGLVRRSVVPGRDGPGVLVGDYVPAGRPGERLVIEITADGVGDFGSVTYDVAGAQRLTRKIASYAAGPVRFEIIIPSDFHGARAELTIEWAGSLGGALLRCLYLPGVK
ncbi:glycosyltransferase [Caulobacter sp. CCUG 60055]|uniref:glycosyltransferase n=1 Tax=Caulobacter sp. CCUG 60055 TaxID=2100090 RepID=UPI001FA74421|nr:glycosyltransferase [Caulobacter sp. CCUG 60055]